MQITWGHCSNTARKSLPDSQQAVYIQKTFTNHRLKTRTHKETCFLLSLGQKKYVRQEIIEPFAADGLIL